MKISVLGAGGWGTTLAILLHFNGHEITLWEYKKNYARYLIKTRDNKYYLPGIPIPPEINITHDITEATTHQNMIVLAVPSQYLRNVMSAVSYSDIKDSILVSVAKGIENKFLMTMSQMLKDEFPEISSEQIGVLSGPSHAEEVSRRIPTAVVAASKSIETSKTIQTTFITSYFRVYSSTDILGVELGGAFKNVIAIGAGIIDGAKFGDNTKAAIMTRGVAEITRLGLAMGAQADTFAGLSGMGDLIVTCMSRHSRNRYVGEQIGRGKKLKEVLKSMEMVAEGVETSRSAVKLAQKHSVETPITQEVYKILFEDKDPIKATYDLMTRDKKMESVQDF
ncbi:MAG: NAD(P)H-dependent glycerol-3-phosphate dehydrogenase [Ignavibacteriaceae bacterium]|nr:NAD(P)H-dependent glycerol-3-phosphate dehydrogenase [Ignavibacteriaceae bacterium]